MLVLLKRKGMRRFFSSRSVYVSDQNDRPNIAGQMVILTGRYFEPCDVNMNMSYWDGF